MKKNFTFTMFLAVCLLFGFSVNAQVTVTNSNDSGMGSLRQAVLDASAGNTITFALTTNGNTITLNSEITIDKELIINGNGDEATIISGGDSNRIFNISGATQVTINNISFTGGAASDNGGALFISGTDVLINNSAFTNNTASGATAGMGGGAIYVMGDSDVTINASSLTGNEADGMTGSGGAILVGTGSNLTVNDCIITGNMAGRAGGGIEGNSGAGTMITLTDVTLNNNTTASSPGNGGGLHITGAGDTMITGGTVNNNTASAEGGGLWNGSGTMTVEGTVISGNTASGDGADQGGGGIYNLSGTLNVNAETVISNNIADGASGSGGGILNDAGATLVVTEAEIIGNVSNRAGGGIEDNSGMMGSVTLTDVMITNNTTNNSPGNGGGLHVTGMGMITINGGEVSGNMAGAEGGGLWNGTGTMNIDGTVINGNTASGDGADQGGGGIYNLNGGTLVIANATISNNIADGTLGSGGGILNDVGSQLTVTDSEISGNTAVRAGGGIEDNSGISTIMLTNVMLTGNSVSGPPGNGGGLHITGSGSATITGGMVSNNYAGLQGGGLWNGSGTMTITDVTIQNNEAAGGAATDGGGGVFNVSGMVSISGSTITGNTATGVSGSGGGIFSSNGTVNIDDTMITLNSANRAGGGIEVIDGTLMISTSALNENDVNGTAGTPNPGNGGALHISGATMFDISESTVSANIAAREGGGLWNQNGSTMTVTNVTISDNIAAGVAADDGGGGIFNNGGTLNVSNSTISGNSATGLLGQGGGIHINAGSAMVVKTTISGNTALTNGGGIYNNAELMINANTITLNAATVSGGGISNNSMMSPTVTNTILAGNLAIVAGADVYAEGEMVTSMGYNLIGIADAEAYVSAETDITGSLTTPLEVELLALADNGGSTFTHKLGCPSAAADMGDPDDNSQDQTGQDVFNGRRDIGAYESQEACSLDTEDFAASAVRSIVYPNPSNSGVFNIELAQNHGDNAGVAVYDLGTGKLVMEMKADAMATALNMEELASGTYVMQIVSDFATETHKIVIRR